MGFSIKGTLSALINLFKPRTKKATPAVSAPKTIQITMTPKIPDLRPSWEKVQRPKGWHRLRKAKRKVAHESRRRNRIA